MLSVLDQTCMCWHKFVFLPLRGGPGWSHFYAAVVCVNSFSEEPHLRVCYIQDREDPL